MTKTSKLALGFSSALLATALIAPAITVYAQQGVGEQAGEALDNAGRNIKRGVQNAFARSRATVHEQEVLARVYSRIHWDKMLVGSTLELEVRDDGTALLRGAVPTKAARERAVLLARDTVGVNKVVDELTVLPPPRVIVAPPVTTEPAPAATISKP
jgi:hyperosmotically inducible periplasmic protein